MNKQPTPAIAPDISKSAIYTTNLSRKFGAFTAVDALNINVKKNTIYGFLGPNGCGKSTTIRMLCGLLSPSSGSAEVLGLNIPKQAEKLRTHIGYMTQRFSLYEDLTAKENLLFMGKVYGLESRTLNLRINELLNTYKLTTLHNQLTGSMSGGQRQRLALATATLHKPSLLFLDEPTSAVDPENRRFFWEKLFDLCEQNTTILVSTHYMDEAERCHRLAILEEGQLRAEGEPTKLMQQMGASTVEIAADNLHAIKNKLAHLPNIKSVTQLGLRLRVLVSDSIVDPTAYLQNTLTGHNAEITIAHPSLEDVFVTVTHGERR